MEQGSIDVGRAVTSTASVAGARLVLVAEDDRAVRESLERALVAAGHRVRTAVDGAVALEVAARERPDVLVVDVVIPNVDGLQLYRRLRQSGDRTPILLLTARREVKDRVEGLDAPKRAVQRQRGRARSRLRCSRDMSEHSGRREVRGVLAISGYR